VKEGEVICTEELTRISGAVPCVCDCEMDLRMNLVLQDVFYELGRAQRKHPFWPEALWRQALVVREEMGEVDRAVLSFYENEDRTSDGAPGMSPTEANGHIDMEMVQVAAMALRFLFNRRRVDGAPNRIEEKA
jgi:hypothetical protein